jgi:hypothetical protein
MTRHPLDASRAIEAGITGSLDKRSWDRAEIVEQKTIELIASSRNSGTSSTNN